MTNLKIVMLDDDPEVLDDFESYFSSNGHSLEKFQESLDEGEQAIKYLEQNDVDLILIDHYLSNGFEGIKFIKKLKDIKRHLYTPKVILSNSDSSDVIIPYLTKYSADHYITKTSLNGKNCNEILKEVFDSEKVKQKIENRNPELRLRKAKKIVNNETLVNYLALDLEEIASNKQQKRKLETIRKRLEYINLLSKLRFTRIINHLNKYDFVISRMIPLPLLQEYHDSIVSRDKERGQELEKQIFKDFIDDDSKRYNTIQVYFKLYNSVGNYRTEACYTAWEITRHKEKYKHLLHLFNQNFLEFENNVFELQKEIKSNLFVEHILLLLTKKGLL